MTIKERLHHHVDGMDEERAAALLLVLEPDEVETDGRTDAPGTGDETHRGGRDVITRARAADDHPIWDVVGIGSPDVRPDPAELVAMIGSIRSDEPTDIANHKDAYIADAIEHGWR